MHNSSAAACTTKKNPWLQAWLHNVSFALENPGGAKQKHYERIFSNLKVRKCHQHDFSRFGEGDDLDTLDTTFIPEIVNRCICETQLLLSNQTVSPKPIQLASRRPKVLVSTYGCSGKQLNKVWLWPNSFDFEGNGGSEVEYLSFWGGGLWFESQIIPILYF